ncbi:hypothetical protein [Allosphingosinicella vermicomposti]|uniref:hypothetical protein n=1 Tax=Allosphingosinicella vermicomposti TaxID=614671 RepID=UPI000D0EAC05|nr:hypothetical protein [Allosphingosinicella vermicomposti]
MSFEYFQARAAEARRDADAANLANVRERCLRSEAAFLDMAARAERGARMKSKLEAEKAAAQAQDEHDGAETPPLD